MEISVSFFKIGKQHEKVKKCSDCVSSTQFRIQGCQIAKIMIDCETLFWFPVYLRGDIDSIPVPCYALNG